MNTINERLRLLRKSLNLYQGDFAKKMGLSQTSLSMIESGHNPLTDKNIKLICATFNVSEQWLRDGKGEMFNALSPYAKELEEILDHLKPETQEYLLLIARELLTVQRKLVRKYGPEVLNLPDEDFPPDLYPAPSDTAPPPPNEPNPSDITGPKPQPPEPPEANPPEPRDIPPPDEPIPSEADESNPLAAPTPTAAETSPPESIDPNPINSKKANEPEA